MKRDEYGRPMRGPSNRDTTNPEPQWLRQDREQRRREEWRAASGRDRDRPWGGGDPSRDYDYGSTWGARGSYDDDRDELDLGPGRNYAPFRVGTGMGMGTPGYGRSSFGSGYGDASGYGHTEFGSNYGSRSGWDLGTHQRDQAPAARSFRGLGPQNYTRADERIRDDIHERLTDSHDVDARKILVEVNQGNVTLSGTVQHRRMRYAAEDLVESVMGVANIENQLRVQEESAPPPAASETKRH